MKCVLLATALLLAPLGTASAAPRAEVEQVRRLEETGRSLALRRAGLEKELEALAARIESRKVQNRGRVLPDGELDALLRRSQALAEELAALHRQEEAGRAELQRLLERRLAEQEAALAAARAGGATETLASLEAARNATRRQLEGLRPRAEGVLPGAVRPGGDDPDEVREQADLLRDQRDRVLAQLQRVEKRLAEARQEERLSRQLRDFVSETELFEDGGRVMRGRSTRRRELPRDDEAASPSPPMSGEFDGAVDPGLGRDDAEPPAGIVTRFGTRPAGAFEGPSRRIPSLEGDESVAELVSQRRTLQELAEELQRQAEALEAKARRLASPPTR